jgi:hypothetical protein
VIKESRVMRDLHKVREEFYGKTRGKSRGYILKLIKEETRKIKQELEATHPDPNLVEKEWSPTREANSTEEIHQIRERRPRYDS